MEVPEAIQTAQAHLVNAMEQAKMPLVKEGHMYQWDNQISSIDDFLADTEILKDKLLERARESLRKVKKELTDAVVAFEAKQEGVEIEEDEPSDDEWVESYMGMAGDMLEMTREALGEKVKDMAGLFVWEEPLTVINGYLADSEPFQDKNHDLKKARSLVRVARRDLKNSVEAAVRKFRSNDADDDDD
jgi:hypothetical protein